MTYFNTCAMEQTSCSEIKGNALLPFETVKRLIVQFQTHKSVEFARASFIAFQITGLLQLRATQMKSDIVILKHK